MKISADQQLFINSAHTQYEDKTLKSQKTQNKNISTTRDPNFSPVSSTISRGRTFNNALTIAQVSNNLIQEALIISSRLKAMASETMLTGSLNKEELKTEMARVQGTINEYGGTILSPGLETKPSTRDMYNELYRVSDKLLSGNIPEQREFEGINNGLKELRDHYTDLISNIQGKDKYPQSSYREWTAGTARQVSLNAQESIISNPELATTAQGNIQQKGMNTLF